MENWQEELAGFFKLTGGDIPHIEDFKPAEEIERLQNINAELLKMCKGALAALSQAKTYPADIEAAKSFLALAISKTERSE